LRQEVGEVLGVNEVGAQVLSWLSERLTLDEVIERIVSHYGVERSEAENDVLGFVSELLKSQILVTA